MQFSIRLDSLFPTERRRLLESLGWVAERNNLANLTTFGARERHTGYLRVRIDQHHLGVRWSPRRVEEYPLIHINHIKRIFNL